MRGREKERKREKERENEAHNIFTDSYENGPAHF